MFIPREDFPFQVFPELDSEVNKVRNPEGLETIHIKRGTINFIRVKIND